MKLSTFSVALLAMLPGGVMAAGYYLPNQDAFATARGNAFVATADTAAAVHYNPAGMTQVKEPSGESGLYAIVLGTETDAGGVNSKAQDELQVAPQVYYVHPFNDRLSFGFGLNSPFGLGTNWGRDTPFSPVVTEARLLFASATSAVAYKVTDELSLGASVSLNYADLLLEQGLGVPGSFLRFTGDDYGVSGTLSAHWQPHEKHAFGLIYSTESTFDLTGKTESNGLAPDFSASLDFMTPARLAGGYSYRPAPGWNIEANVEWLAWDQLNDLTLESDSVGGSAPVPFDWQSSFIYEVGASYTTPEGWVFAAGYDLNMNSQPDENFNPGVADADRHWFNVGVGRKCESFSWMVGYQFGYSNRTVDGAAGVNALANGDYESRHNALFFSWQQSF
jgi:long-chain fatty acid transport protein